jgi:membrane protein DedA with SNARE-associated domain
VGRRGSGEGTLPSLLGHLVHHSPPKQIVPHLARADAGAAPRLRLVLGGLAGCFIGLTLFEQIGRPVIEFYHATETFNRVGEIYRENLVLALGSAGFTPIPYKVFTIAAGAFSIPLLPFVVISLVSRAMRFFLVAGLIFFFGPPVKRFIDRYLNLLTIVFVLLLVAGFAVIKLVSG